MIADSIIDVAPGLPAPPHREIQRSTCWVFGGLAYQDRTETKSREFLRNKSITVLQRQTVLALIRSRLAVFPELEVSQATVNGNVVDVLKGTSICPTLDDLTNFVARGQGLEEPSGSQRMEEMTCMEIADDVFQMAIAVGNHIQPDVQAGNRQGHRIMGGNIKVASPRNKSGKARLEIIMMVLCTQSSIFLDDSGRKHKRAPQI
ncbi:hypothetical protein C8R45DRAFT_945194 [Mycena sanguinolenta]|nr:hypothetical protein C8R45DRAFT_945194 [Mycena sanguinolenta]